MTGFAIRLARFRSYVAAEQERSGRAAIVAALTVVYWKLWRRSPRARQIRITTFRATRSRRSAVVHARLGDELIEEGRQAEAIAAWERALAVDPMLLDLYEKCAAAYYFLGRLDDVVHVHRRWIELQEQLAHQRQVDQLGFRIVHPAYAGAIGHMAETDIVVKQQLLLGRPMDELLYIARDHHTANRSYLEYWLQYFPRQITSGEGASLLRPLEPLLRVPFQAWRSIDGEVRYFYAIAHQVQRRWEAETRPPLLRLTEEHRARGRETLRSLGMPEEAWFVGLHVREDPGLTLRNAKIATYDAAVEAVVAHGGWVVRMGDPSMSRLPPLENVIDYAHSEAKSDWMDVFLWAEGRFLIGTSSGPAQVPQTFGKPVLLTNWVGPPYWHAHDVYLPKLYWSDREHRLLTFAEALSTRASLALLGHEVEMHGLRARDNTAEELTEGVHEMLDLLEGRDERSPGDEALRRRLEQIEAPWEHPSPLGGGARIGRSFLRRHADLLDPS